MVFLYYLAVGTMLLRRELYKPDSEMTWFQAKSYCQYHYTDLLSIKNKQENIQIRNGWIDLHRTDSVWRWSRENVAADNIPWATGEPGYQEHCGLKWSGQFHSDECDNIHTANCVDEPLVLVKENKTWEEALEHCRSLTVPDSIQRYELAELLTPRALSVARHMVNFTAIDEVWLGLRYLGGHWTWVGGRDYHTSRWTCPNIKRCGMLHSDRIFRDKCQLKKYFLCSRIRLIF